MVSHLPSFTPTLEEYPKRRACILAWEYLCRFFGNPEVTANYVRNHDRFRLLSPIVRDSFMEILKSRQAKLSGAPSVGVNGRTGEESDLESERNDIVAALSFLNSRVRQAPTGPACIIFHEEAGDDDLDMHLDSELRRQLVHEVIMDIRLRQGVQVTSGEMLLGRPHTNDEDTVMEGGTEATREVTAGRAVHRDSSSLGIRRSELSGRLEEPKNPRDGQVG